MTKEELTSNIPTDASLYVRYTSQPCLKLESFFMFFQCPKSLVAEGHFFMYTAASMPRILLHAVP